MPRTSTNNFSRPGQTANLPTKLPRADRVYRTDHVDAEGNVYRNVKVRFYKLREAPDSESGYPAPAMQPYRKASQ